MWDNHEIKLQPRKKTPIYKKQHKTKKQMEITNETEIQIKQEEIKTTTTNIKKIEDNYLIKILSEKKNLKRKNEEKDEEIKKLKKQIEEERLESKHFSHKMLEQVKRYMEQGEFFKNQLEEEKSQNKEWREEFQHVFINTKKNLYRAEEKIKQISKREEECCSICLEKIEETKKFIQPPNATKSFISNTLSTIKCIQCSHEMHYKCFITYCNGCPICRNGKVEEREEEFNEDELINQESVSEDETDVDDENETVIGNDENNENNENDENENPNQSESQEV